MKRRWWGLGLVLGTALTACAAVSADPQQDGDDDGAAGAPGGTGGSTGEGGGLLEGVGGGSVIVPPVTELSCPEVAQEILVLDFRSGWWSGGGGGNFADSILRTMSEVCTTKVEYHHFEIDFRVKCSYAGGAGSCTTTQDAIASATLNQILTWFDEASWDEYTQVWILSGSEQDATDVAVSGALFDHFLSETNGSCVPALIGGGDGFITHGNAVTAELGLGEVFHMELPAPSFFSVMAEAPPYWVTVNGSTTALEDHVLFTDVTSLVDVVGNSFGQVTHGDSLVSSDRYQVIAHDSAGRPTIAVGAIDLPGDGDRPFILDAGLQRFYGIGQDASTTHYLQNLVQYLGLVGCKADIPE
ncbi:MAG: hypothetical protein R3B72_35790 [Polyangiaceae bacterium]